MLDSLLIGLVAVAIPAAAVGAVVYALRHPSQHRGGSGSAAVGAAFQQFDKLVARPSIEHVESARTPIVTEDDRGGE